MNKAVIAILQAGVSWDGYLYKLGNEYADITGGWSQKSQTGSSYSYAENPSYLTLVSGDPSSGVRAGIANGIDVTQYSTINVKINAAISSTGKVGLEVYGVNPTTWAQASLIYSYKYNNSSVPTDYTISIDISSLNQVAYPAFTVASGATVNITEMWLA